MKRIAKHVAIALFALAVFIAAIGVGEWLIPPPTDHPVEPEGRGNVDGGRYEEK